MPAQPVNRHNLTSSNPFGPVPTNKTFSNALPRPKSSDGPNPNSNPSPNSFTSITASSSFNNNGPYARPLHNTYRSNSPYLDTSSPPPPSSKTSFSNPSSPSTRSNGFQSIGSSSLPVNGQPIMVALSGWPVPVFVAEQQKLSSVSSERRRSRGNTPNFGIGGIPSLSSNEIREGVDLSWLNGSHVQQKDNHRSRPNSPKPFSPITSSVTNLTSKIPSNPSSTSSSPSSSHPATFTSNSSSIQASSESKPVPQYDPTMPPPPLPAHIQNNSNSNSTANTTFTGSPDQVESDTTPLHRPASMLNPNYTAPRKLYRHGGTDPRYGPNAGLNDRALKVVPNWSSGSGSGSGSGNVYGVTTSNERSKLGVQGSLVESGKETSKSDVGSSVIKSESGPTLNPTVVNSRSGEGVKVDPTSTRNHGAFVMRAVPDVYPPPSSRQSQPSPKSAPISNLPASIINSSRGITKGMYPRDPDNVFLWAGGVSPSPSAGDGLSPGVFSPKDSDVKMADRRDEKVKDEKMDVGVEGE